MAEGSSQLFFWLYSRSLGSAGFLGWGLGGLLLSDVGLRAMTSTYASRATRLRQETGSRFLSSPLIMRLSFYLLFGCNEGTQKSKKCKRVLLGNLVDPESPWVTYRTF